MHRIFATVKPNNRIQSIVASLFFAAFLVFSQHVSAQWTPEFSGKLKTATEAKINLLRAEKKLPALTTDPVLDRAAVHHSIYQSEHDELTHEEKTPGFLTPSSRVRKFGGDDFESVGENCLFIQVPESLLVTKNIDSLANVMAQNWKNSPKHYLNITSKRYKNGSLGFEYDPSTGKLYATQVFGTKGIRVNNQLSKNAFGITKADKNCIGQFGSFSNLVYNLGNDLTIFGRQVVLSVSDKTLLERMWNSDKDGLAIDLVHRKQFPCGKENQFDFSPVYDGIMLEPMYKKQILEANYAESDYRYNGVIAIIPENLNPEDYELSLILIDEGKACEYIFPVEIPDGNLDPIPYNLELNDPKTLRLQTSGIIESKIISFNFNSNDTIPTSWPTIPHLKYPIKKIQVQTYASVDGDSTNNVRLQKGRAEVIKRYLTAKLNVSSDKITVDSRENWDMMRYQLRYYGYGKLSEKSTMQIRKDLPDLIALPTAEMYRNQRRAIAAIEYEGTLTGTVDSVKIAELSLRTGLETENQPLVEKALATLYRQQYVPSFIFSEPYFSQLREHSGYVQNFAALLTLNTKKYRHEIARCIDTWAKHYKGIRESGRRNMLYLYALGNGDILRIWDLDAERLKNILSPERLYPVKEMTTITNEELLFDLHLTFIEYYGQINKSAEIEKSFSYLMSYMEKGNLPLKKHIDLALFCNRWSRYDLTVARMKSCLDKNMYNAESLMLLLKTSTLYRDELPTADYQKVVKLASQKATKQLCAWIRQNFQVQRYEDLKTVRCQICGG